MPVLVERDERDVRDVLGRVGRVPGDINSLTDGPHGRRVRDQDRRRPDVALLNFGVRLRVGARSGDRERRADIAGVAEDCSN